MSGKSVFVVDIQLALYERHEIINSRIGYIISRGNYELVRKELLLVRDKGSVSVLDNDRVRHLVHAAEYHHLAGLAAESASYACCSDSLSLVDISLGAEVRGASLHNV